MGGRSIALVSALFAAAGCSSDKTSFGLPPSGGAVSAILTVESAEAGFSAYAVDLAAPIELEVREGDGLLLLLYGESLEALQVSRGKIARAQPDAPSREIPSSDDAYSAVFSPGHLDWEDASTAERSAAFASFQIPVKTPAACAEDGLCYPNEDAELCIPCEAPVSVLEPSFQDQPAQPEPPELTPCPADWIESMQRALPFAICLPTGEPGPMCPEGEIRPPHAESCEPIGDDCPLDGRFDIPAGGGNVLHVNPTAPAGGDGTRANPYQRIAEALMSAATGTFIVLDSGTYSEDITVHDVELIGACAKDTIIDGTVRLEDGAVLDDVTVDAKTGSAIVATGGSRVSIYRVETHADAHGLHLDPGSAASVHRFRADGVGGFGIDVDHATLQASSSVIEQATSGGVSLTGGTATVTQTRIEAAPNLVRALQGAELTLDAAYLASATDTAVYVASGSSVRARDSVVSAPGASEGLITASGGRRVSLQRVSLEHGASGAIWVDATAFTAHDVVAVRADPELAPNGDEAVLYLGEDATVEVARAFFDDLRGDGIFSAGESAIVDVSDLSVRGAAGEFSNPHKNAVYLHLAASGSLSRIRSEHMEIGLRLNPGAGEVSASDLSLIDGVQGGQMDCIRPCQGSVSIQRVLVRGASDWGTWIGGNFRLDLEDGLFEDNELGGLVQNHDGPPMSLSRVRFRNNRGAALSIAGPDTFALLRDLIIEGTDQNAPEICRGHRCIGHALYARSEASVDLERFRFSDNTGCGIFVAALTETHITDGEVDRNTFGACAKTDGEIRTITNRVFYHDNEQQVLLGMEGE